MSRPALQDLLPAGADAELSEMARSVPVRVDESCHDRASLPGLRGNYDMVNIKLDKTGGPTQALTLRAAARGAQVTDLDGPAVSGRRPG